MAVGEIPVFSSDEGNPLTSIQSSMSNLTGPQSTSTHELLYQILLRLDSIYLEILNVQR